MSDEHGWKTHWRRGVEYLNTYLFRESRQIGICTVSVTCACDDQRQHGRVSCTRRFSMEHSAEGHKGIRMEG
jgi:hypothetical protein